MLCSRAARPDRTWGGCPATPADSDSRIDIRQSAGLAQPLIREGMVTDTRMGADAPRSATALMPTPAWRCCASPIRTGARGQSRSVPARRVRRSPSSWESQRRRASSGTGFTRRRWPAKTANARPSTSSGNRLDHRRQTIRLAVGASRGCLRGLATPGFEARLENLRCCPKSLRWCPLGSRVSRAQSPERV
jgi:hypothetical protein